MSEHDAGALTVETEDETPVVYVRAVAASDVLDRSAHSDIEVANAPEDDAVLYAVHDETGRRVGVFSERAAAFAAARWHGAAPVSAH